MSSTTSEDPAPVHVAISRVLGDLPAIGKSDYNAQQKFHFRGVDAVLNALNPLLAEHGLTVLPYKVVERIASTRSTKSGSVMYEVNLHVRFRLIGPAGDFLEGEAWGEGTDSGDKATSKAHTAAQKSFLIQAFSISTQEQSDDEPDRHSPEETVPVVLASEAVRNDLRRRIAALPEGERKALGVDWKATFAPLARLAAADVDDASDLVAAYERRAVASAAPEAAGPPSTEAAAPPSAEAGRPFEDVPA